MQMQRIALTEDPNHLFAFGQIINNVAHRTKNLDLVYSCRQVQP